jgi:hypothetical protein
MSTTENNRDSASKTNTDEAMQVHSIQESMTSIKQKFKKYQSLVGLKICEGFSVKTVVSAWSCLPPGLETEQSF